MCPLHIFLNVFIVKPNEPTKSFKARYLVWFDEILNASGPPNLEKITESGPLFGVISPRPTGITVDKSLEFSYEELAKATNNFSMENKIGQGGFGLVFYGMLKGEVCGYFVSEFMKHNT